VSKPQESTDPADTSQQTVGATTRGVTVTVQKGGVGKTSIAINLAERLAARGYEVLLVDVDHQGSATEGVGQGDAYTDDTHLGHVVDPDDPTEPDALVRPAGGETAFRVLPANAELHETAAALQTAEDGEARLYRTVVTPLADQYDWLVFDTPPTLGPLSTAAMVATRRILVPLQLSEPSADALVRTVTHGVFPLNDRLNDSIELLALVPNRVKGDNEERRVLEEIEDSSFGAYLPPFARSRHFDDADSPGPGIRERVAIRRSYREGVPLATYDPDSDMVDRFDALASVVEMNWAHNR
jgi:chromosome partitioning protein